MTTINRKARIAMGTVAAMLMMFAISACAPQQGSSSLAESGEGPSDSQADNPAIEVVWSEDADCSTCHTAEGDSMTDTTCAAAMHAAVACADCHTDTAALSKVHEGKTTADLAPKRLKKTAVSDETCTSGACHNLEDIKAATANDATLTDANGLVVNQHDLPAHESHAEIICSDCHKLHSSSDETAEDATALCQSCHHANVYECYTCHEHS